MANERITITLAGAVARRFPDGDVKQITGDIIEKLKLHGVRLLQDGEVLLSIAEGLEDAGSEPDDAVQYSLENL
jgi:hypothetical protein